MKKRILACLCIFMLLCSALPFSASAATGTATIKASATSVTVGSTVTLTITYTSTSVGAGTAVISYDDNLFGLESISGNGTYNPDAAGIVQYTFADTSKKSSYSFTCKFKAKQAGACTFQLDSRDLVTFDEEPFTVTTQKVSVSATNPTLSANANLSSLKPSAGTLTPAFSANTTTYTITVPYTVTSLSLSATTADKNAKVAVSGSNSLKVGKNTQTVTVTAPNGTTKKYTVTITRSANQSNSSNTGTTTSTTLPPEEEPLEVSVDGVLMTVADTQPEVALPEGYAWEPTEVNGVMVSAAVNKDAGLTLLYLTSTTEDKSALYIYGEDGLFTLFQPLTVKAGLYTLLPMPEALDAPAGTVAGQLTVEDITVDAWTYEDTALGDIALIYAVGPTGHTGLYVYDKTDGSMQQYRELTPPAEPEPVEEEEPANGFVRFVTDYRNVILITAAACGGVALLIGAIVLIVVMARRPTGYRH